MKPRCEPTPEELEQMNNTLGYITGCFWPMALIGAGMILTGLAVWSALLPHYR